VLLEDVPVSQAVLLIVAAALAAAFAVFSSLPISSLPTSPALFLNQRLQEFEFHPGPIFSQVVLADEINRATPRTQSALLECMDERQVTIEGETLPWRDFLVMATQKSGRVGGTFPLPRLSSTVSA